MALRNISVSRPSLEIPAGGVIYFHGVRALSPVERPSVAPFSMEEKGIDGRGFVFAWDHGRLRYYLSVIPAEFMFLGYQPGAWTPLDSMAMIRFMVRLLWWV